MRCSATWLVIPTIIVVIGLLSCNSEQTPLSASDSIEESTSSAYTDSVGVPILSDSDSDGIPDKDDNCPQEWGTVENKGCPPLLDSGPSLDTTAFIRSEGSSPEAKLEMPARDTSNGPEHSSKQASLAYAYRQTIPLHEFRYVSVVIDANQLLPAAKRQLAGSLGEERAKEIRSDDTSTIEGFTLPAAKFFYIRLRYDTSVFDAAAEMPDTQQLDINGRIEWRWQVYGKKVVQESQMALYVYYANNPDSGKALSSRIISMKVTVENTSPVAASAPLPDTRPKNRGWLIGLLVAGILAAVGWFFVKRRKKQGGKKIYFSYAWNDATKKLVSAMYASLKAAGFQVMRDESDLRYQGSITQFMTDIGNASFAIVVITDKYLKSKFCMFELYELYRKSDMNVEVLKKKIFPIRLEEIDLSNPDVQMAYIDFWEAKELEMEQLLKANINTLTAEQTKQYQVVKRIKDEIGNILPALSDLNANTTQKLSENDFSAIKSAIRAAVSA